jgi:uncharacterized protein (TIGR03435 family)
MLMSMGRAADYRWVCKPRALPVAFAIPIFARLVALVAISPLAIPGQSKSTAITPAFEVAAVKRTDPKVHVIWMCTNPGGRVTVDNYTLRMLIEEVYSVQEFQVEGGPRWANDETYSIEAIPPRSSELSKVRTRACKTRPSQEELLMLRALLADRFKLTVHEETKPGLVYNLVLTSEHPKLSPPADKNTYSVVVYGFTGVAEHPDFMRGENATMAQFAERLSWLLEHPVIDQTGLKGRFDFTISFVKEPTDPSQGPSLFTSVRDLGLKLESSKAPVRRLVIDHADKPSDN